LANSFCHGNASVPDGTLAFLMDKKHKQHRQKTITPEELEVAPPGASFNTKEGRAAQGMRPDIGEETEKQVDPDEAKAPDQNDE